jgi:hypothetical protein
VDVGLRSCGFGCVGAADLCGVGGGVCWSFRSSGVAVLWGDGIGVAFCRAGVGAWCGVFSGVGTGFGVEIGVRSGVGFAAGVVTFGWRFGGAVLVGFGIGVETGLLVGTGETSLGGTFVFGGGVVPGVAVGETRLGGTFVFGGGVVPGLPVGETRLGGTFVFGGGVVPGLPVGETRLGGAFVFGGGVVPGLAAGVTRLGGTLIFGEPVVAGLPVGDGVIALGGRLGFGLGPALTRPGGKLPVGRALGLPPGLTGDPEGLAAAATNRGVARGIGFGRFCGTGFCRAITWRSWVAWVLGTFCHPRWITGLGICCATVGRTLEIA